MYHLLLNTRLLGACNEIVETFTIMQFKDKRKLTRNFANAPNIHFSVIVLDYVYSECTTDRIYVPY